MLIIIVIILLIVKIFNIFVLENFEDSNETNYYNKMSIKKIKDSKLSTFVKNKFDCNDFTYIDENPSIISNNSNVDKINDNIWCNELHYSML